MSENIDAGWCILVADDNQDAADSLSELSRLLGNSVVTAYDGAQAVELARVHCPQVAFLDIHMPHLDGYGAARQLRQACDALVMFVAATGALDQETEQKALAAGFDQCVAKPMELSTLRTLLAEALRRLQRLDLCGSGRLTCVAGRRLQCLREQEAPPLGPWLLRTPSRPHEDRGRFLFNQDKHVGKRRTAPHESHLG